MFVLSFVLNLLLKLENKNLQNRCFTRKVPTIVRQVAERLVIWSNNGQFGGWKRIVGFSEVYELAASHHLT